MKMKKILVIITVLMLLVGCTNTKETKQVQADAAKFKEEYESLKNDKFYHYYFHCLDFHILL